MPLRASASGPSSLVFFILVLVMVIGTCAALPLPRQVGDNEALLRAAKLEVRGKSWPGSVDVYVDGELWLPAGAGTSFNANSSVFSVEDGTLELQKTTKESGQDSLGMFESVRWSWKAGNTFFFETAVRAYKQPAGGAAALVFEQTWISGAKKTEASSVDDVCSKFPSFGMPSNEMMRDQRNRKGYLQYDQDMIGAAYHIGEWSPASNLTGGIAGTAPICIFQEDMQASLVLSPLSNAMATNHAYDANAKQLSYGVMGGVKNVPAGYRLETVIVLSSGVGNAMISWGDVMLSKSGKSRAAAWERDFTLSWLGYSTDNGAYYYYNTEEGKNYEQTMLDVAAYANRSQIPYQYWLADSWWYYKGPLNGVVNWTSMPSVFPHGLNYLYDRTGWVVQGHNRYWSAETTYAKENGGKWNFLVDKTGGYALPHDQDFWNFLMRSSREWGLTVYEQDWLNDEFDRFPPLTESATLGRDWLQQMGSAAAENGLSIQYCMSYCRHLLASIEIPAVSQARASDDYHPGNDQWQPLGTTAMLAYALGVAPSKDNYWSTTVQPGNRWGNSTIEPYNRLQAAVISLSKGPVCPSDAVGKSDRDLIMRSAMENGRLLSPGRPAFKLDATFVQAAFPDRVDLPAGEVWFAESIVSGRRYGVILAARVPSDIDLLPTLLGYSSEARLVTVDTTTPSLPREFSEKRGVHIRKCDKKDFQLFNVAPVEPSGWALLGEVHTKWVGVSPARFTSISSGNDLLEVGLRGAPGELVSVAFSAPLDSSETEAVVVECRVGPSGSATVSMPSRECTQQ